MAEPTSPPPSRPQLTSLPAAVLDDFPPHRPEVLVLSFLGSFVMPRGRPAIPSRVFIDVLREIGITEGATRSALARMTRRELLLRHVSGRNRCFSPSPLCLALLVNGAKRVSAAEPFKHPDQGWTLFAFTVPETRRDVRHQLRARLLWAGFGPLRDGLWIAPGAVDVEPLLVDLPLDGADAQPPWAFIANALAPTHLPSLIHRVWDVPAIRDEHRSFSRRWAGGIPEDLGPMAARTLLVADWLRLLRADPGLPAEYLGDHWPAERSTRVFQSTLEELRLPSQHELTKALLVHSRPRYPSR